VFSGNVTGKMVNETHAKIVEILSRDSKGIFVPSWVLEGLAVFCCFAAVGIAALRLKRLANRRALAKRQAESSKGVGFVNYGASGIAKGSV
jgi:hypothetical protein